MVSEQDVPRIGSRYVLFLTGTNTESVFEILTGYEIREASVYALDDLPKPRSYENTTPANLLNELRMKLALSRERNPAPDLVPLVAQIFAAQRAISSIAAS
jgi:hypothetical protein